MTKNKWGWAVIGLMAGMMLTACGGTTEGEESPYSADEINQLEGVTMETTEASYPVGTEMVDLVIKNDSDEEVYYGVAFSVEKQDGNRWVIVPFEDDVSWIEIALMLAPKGQNEETVSFDLLENELTEGTYRIIKEIAGNPVSAEFEIVETE